MNRKKEVTEMRAKVVPVDVLHHTCGELQYLVGIFRPTLGMCI